MMEEYDRSPSPSRSSLPPPLHRHLRSAPQSSCSMPIIAAHTQVPWPSGQRSMTDPAFYTYPPPLNTSRESALLLHENQQVEMTHGWQIVPQPEVPFWDERFPHPQRIGHAESYTRADDSGWGGSYSSSRRADSSDWRPVSLGQIAGHTRPSFNPEILRSQRVLEEPSPSCLSSIPIPYTVVSDGPSARVYERPIPNASVTAEPAHNQAYLRSTSSHVPPGISTADDFVSPLLASVLLDAPGPPTTADGSSSETGQGDPAEESHIKIACKGKQRVSGSLEEGLTPLRRFRKKTEIACNFCRGRKLGCSGDRPKCRACIKRGGECAYEATARRRGPGKAPRGSRKPAKARGAGARTQQSTPEGGQSTFPGITFEVPLPPIQTPNADDFDLPPTNGEESQDHRWRADSVDRVFPTSFSPPAWATVT